MPKEFNYIYASKSLNLLKNKRKKKIKREISIEGLKIVHTLCIFQATVQQRTSYAIRHCKQNGNLLKLSFEYLHWAKFIAFDSGP